MLVVNPAKVPAKNAQGAAVALLKAKPGDYNYASSGNGTIIHLAGEMFVEAAGVDVRHIPYKGVGPMVADLIGGQVEMGVVARAGRAGPPQERRAARDRRDGQAARRLAARRADDRRAGLPGRRHRRLVRRRSARPKLPPAEVKRLHEAVVAAFATPEAKEAMAQAGERHRRR